MPLHAARLRHMWFPSFNTPAAFREKLSEVIAAVSLSFFPSAQVIGILIFAVFKKVFLCENGVRLICNRLISFFLFPSVKKYNNFFFFFALAPFPPLSPAGISGEEREKKREINLNGHVFVFSPTKKILKEKYFEKGGLGCKRRLCQTGHTREWKGKEGLGFGLGAVLQHFYLGNGRS